MNPNSSPKIALLWESLFATVKGAVIGNIAIWVGVTLKGSLWLIIGGLALALLILWVVSSLMESWKGGLRNQDQMALLASVTIFERVAAIFFLIGAGLGLYYSWEKSLAGVIGVLAGLVFGLIGTAWGDYSDPMGGPEPPETDD